MHGSLWQELKSTLVVVNVELMMFLSSTVHSAWWVLQLVVLMWYFQKLLLIGPGCYILTELLTKPVSNGYTLRSSTSDSLYVVPYNKPKTFSDRSLLLLVLVCVINCQKQLDSLVLLIFLRKTWKHFTFEISFHIFKLHLLMLRF